MGDRRIRLRAGEIAAHLKIAAETVQAWRDGTARPTAGQITKLGKKLKRTRSLFFLPTAPANAVPTGHYGH